MKATCIPLSLLVFFATWYSFGEIATTRSLHLEMGDYEVGWLAKFAFWLFSIQIPLLILSLGLFLAVVLSSLRYRSGVFLWVFAIQLSIGAILIVILLSASSIVEREFLPAILR